MGGLNFWAQLPAFLPEPGRLHPARGAKQLFRKEFPRPGGGGANNLSPPRPILRSMGNGGKTLT